MKVLKVNGISWFLEDEAFMPCVQELTEQRHMRRSYEIVETPKKKAFVKYFREDGLWGFIRNRIDPRGKREYGMGKNLIACSIATPSPIGYGLGRRGSFALQEWMDAQPFRAAFIEGAMRTQLLGSLADLLHRLRAAGIRHNDLHLDNILVRGQDAFVIDLHKAKIRKIRFFPFDDMLNLVHAVGPIYRDLSEAEKCDFFRLYGGEGIRPSLEKRLAEEHACWIQRKKARAFSTTSKLTKTGRRVYIKATKMTGAEVFVECIKNDRKVRVERHSGHIRKIYRNNRRLKKAWRNHVAIEYLLLPVVPKPFYVQKGTLFENGFIAMEDLGGKGEELDRYLDRHYDAMQPHRARGIIDLLSGFLSILLRKGVLHADMKACNLFVLEDDTFRLLDVEDIVFRPHNDETLCRMFRQLNTSVPRRIRFSDRVRFFLKISEGLGIEKSEKKRLFREVVRASTGEAIIYEGVKGLRKESWTGHHG